MKHLHSEEHSETFQAVAENRKNRKEKKDQEIKPGVRVFLAGTRLTVHR